MKPFPYEEILNLGPPQSGKHPKMAVADRAAQFAPFSALTGHGAGGRLTGYAGGLERKRQLLRREQGLPFEPFNGGGSPGSISAP